MTNKITLEITDRQPFADGMAFGDVGAYERIKGRAHYAVDPDAPAQAGIVDLDKAPRNTDGLVEFSADVMILTPVDPKKGNRRIFYDWGNRGNIRALQFFNDAQGSNDPLVPEHAGNGFFFRRGYSVVFSAWQGDLLPGDGRFLLDLPIATDNGNPITGLVRSEFILESPGVTTQPLSGWSNTRSYPTASLDTSKAQLTRRPYADAPREAIPTDQWMFARNEGGIGLDGVAKQTAIVPSETNIFLPAGFEPGVIYELVYTGRDPLVLGLGHTAVRDLIGFLKHDSTDANPLAGTEKAYGWGRSQTGRAIRDFIHNGYNADANGRQVFDGLLPHVSGGGLMWMNHRFANAVSPAGQEHEVHDNCADRFPFSYTETTDHLTGKTDAILKRPDTDPLVIHTQTATEYWQRRGSLVHTDTQGNDLEQPDSVRIYIWGSSEHYADPMLRIPNKGPCQNFSNVVRTSMLFRAALDNLDRWATDGTPPPDSRHPKRADGTLLSGAEWRAQFPAIPGVMLPHGPATLELYDFGSDFENGLLNKEPPELADAKGYPTMVLATDEDGNDLGCVRAPMVTAPLATYTGWNLRDRGQGFGAKHKFTGSTLPLPETPEERQVTGDPRRSILERYGNKAGYVAAIRTAAEKLVDEGLMLEEDVERCAAWAEDWDRERHGIRLP
ncbi:MAG: hypothetical protein HOH04_01305 [Rhodospirillaceae bacterium]|nr:hypothetical protein [Rhodospirillaceae bacterium]